jgi:hypothetical protein
VFADAVTPALDRYQASAQAPGSAGRTRDRAGNEGLGPVAGHLLGEDTEARDESFALGGG